MDWQTAIAGLPCVLIALHLVLRFGVMRPVSHGIATADAPLVAVLAAGGVPLVLETAGAHARRKASRRGEPGHGTGSNTPSDPRTVRPPFS
jgi:hypothetical protein